MDPPYIQADPHRVSCFPVQKLLPKGANIVRNMNAEVLREIFNVSRICLHEGQCLAFDRRVIQMINQCFKIFALT